MIELFQSGRRNGKQIERDIIGSLLYSNEFMQKRGVVIVAEEKPKTYVMMCFNSRTADTRLRQFVEKNYPWVKQAKFGAGGFKAIMHNGDEHHFVPTCSFDTWMIGRNPDYVIYEEEIEREEKMTADITEKKLYAEVRNRYDSWAIFPKTDAEIIIAQEKKLKAVRGQVDDLKKLADKANEEIKGLNEENKALIEENAKLRKDNKELLDAQEGFDKLCELAKGAFTVEMSALPIIEYQGMKFKATRLVIDENCGTRRTIHIDGTMVSE